MNNTPISASTVEAIVTEYVRIVRGNTSADYDATAAVLDAVATRDLGRSGLGEYAEVIYELLDTAHDLELRPVDDPAESDAWWDAMDDALPAVKAALEAE